MFYWHKNQPKKEVICTICSREKNPAPGLMAARTRYLGGHIRLAESVALAERRPLFILSGMFGLIKADRDIPDYDKRLELTEVDALAARVAQQIVWHRIQTIRYYHEPKESWAPYTQVLQKAQGITGVGFILQALPIEPGVVGMLPRAAAAPTTA